MIVYQASRLLFDITSKITLTEIKLHEMMTKLSVVALSKIYEETVLSAVGR